MDAPPPSNTYSTPVAVRFVVSSNLGAGLRYSSKFDARLQWIASLKENWDSYGAKPIAQKAIDNACTIFEYFYESGITPKSIVPTTDEGITIEYQFSLGSFIFDCFGDGDTVSLFRGATTKDRMAHEIKEDGLMKALEAFRIIFNTIVIAQRK